MYISNALSATLQSLCISDAFCILHRACICTHFSAFLDLHSRAFQAHRCASGLQKSHSLHVLLLRACVVAGGSADAVVGLDKDDSFYLAQKPTSDHKKFYAQKLASILVNGNFTISDDDE